MYAATAFIIMEAADIMLPRLGLPDWTVTFIIILLIVGFPIAILLSWIYDLTPEGIIKSEPTKRAEEKQAEDLPINRKLRISDVVILILLVFICILVYPKIFKRDKFQDIREDDGRISIAVLPFKNTVGDSNYDWYCEGISNILIDGLSLSQELSVIDDRTMFEIIENKDNISYTSIGSTLATEVASSIHVKSYIWGDFIRNKDQLLINLKLVDTESKKVITTESEENHPDSIIQMTRNLSERIRNYLEIESIESEINDEIEEFPATTMSAEAYRYFTEGLRHIYLYSFDLAAQAFQQAIEADSTYTDAYIFISRVYSWQRKDSEAFKYLEKASLSNENISIFHQFAIDGLRAYLDKNQQEMIKSHEKVVKLRPRSFMYWLWMALDYRDANQYENALIAYETAMSLYEKVGLYGKGEGSRSWWTDRAVFNHKLGNHEREHELYEEWLEFHPDNPGIIFHQAACELSLGNVAIAEDYIESFRTVNAARGLEDYRIKDRIGRIYQQAGQFDEAVKIFREIISENPQRHGSNRQLGLILIENEIDIDEGMAIIDQELRMNPDDWDLLYLKGLGLFKQGKVKEASEITTKAWDLRPRYHHEHYILLQEINQVLASQNQ